MILSLSQITSLDPSSRREEKKVKQAMSTNENKI